MTERFRREEAPMFHIPITPENTGDTDDGRSSSKVSGEISQKEAEKPSLESKIDRTAWQFTKYIERLAHEKRPSGKLTSQEAAGLYSSSDLLPGLRGKGFSEDEGREILLKMQGTNFYDTGKTIILPVDLEDANFGLVVVINKGKLQFTLEAKNDMAHRVSGS